MRILTWNINGVRTVPQYHPWNALPTFEDILDKLEADIICFQEMKTSRQGLTKSVAVPPSYNAFFSFPVRKSGYSGVATYTRTKSVVPIKVEEGLCGIIQPKPPLSPEERISRWDAYPRPIIEQEDERRPDESERDLDYKDLDSEGRALVMDFGLFVLVNVYCPNDGIGTEERDTYKSDYHRILEARVKGLVEKEGREVIVVGDLNACAAVIDHCEGHLMVARGKAEGLEGEDGFWGKDVRRWLRGWLVNEDDTGGYMVDIVRRLWPDRKGMYTCWNTKISARDSNYGTRIDYILITRGLLPWVKGADIQPQIKGSDHCPVYLDLQESITNNDGTVVHLRDVLGLKQDGDNSSEPPRLAAKFWDEYSGKQMLLEKFFGRTGDLAPLNKARSPPMVLTKSEEEQQGVDSNAAVPLSDEHTTFSRHSSDTPLALSCSPTTTPSSSLPTQPPTPTQALNSAEPSFSTGVKRKLMTESLTRSSSSKKQKPKKEQEKQVGQTKLSTFFAKPKASASFTPGASSSAGKSSTSRKVRTTKSLVFEDSSVVEADIESDYQLALLLSSQEGPEPAQPVATDTTATKQAWSTLLSPLQPPKCLVHGELAKEFTVNKPGPNKGKKFFICARPVGPGYDKGRAERLREHVDPQWRCNFFKWSSDVRREMRKGEV
ncbi:DNA-(apurinic or apyrimidinic site) lyase 2 [Hypsizygus marmoreus]|uniref:DNA-(apurinic or apyrimidinic site) endonuclease 2 n=1 Tax=Hypsizygus marmoreus TaxID=39966 RepID=A0A369J694_HYPMA|nr:DNA-(apurinic or apyrimidinic site) lyase 2 [Hypsizygus marmoreus]